MARRLVFAAAMCTWLCCGTTAVGQGGGTGGTGGRGGGAVAAAQLAWIAKSLPPTIIAARRDRPQL